MNTCRSGVREAATTQETEEKKNVAAEHPEDVEMEHEEPSDAEGATRKVEGDQEAVEARRRNTAMRLKKVKRKGNTERGVGGRGTAGSRAAEKGRKVEVGHVDRDAKPHEDLDMFCAPRCVRPRRSCGAFRRCWLQCRKLAIEHPTQRVH